MADKKKYNGQERLKYYVARAGGQVPKQNGDSKIAFANGFVDGYRLGRSNSSIAHYYRRHGRSRFYYFGVGHGKKAVGKR